MTAREKLHRLVDELEEAELASTLRIVEMQRHDAEIDASTEQRIFELLGEHRPAWEIADEIGMDLKEAVPVIRKVLNERGTPQHVAIRRSIERIGPIRVI